MEISLCVKISLLSATEKDLEVALCAFDIIFHYFPSPRRVFPHQGRNGFLVKGHNTCADSEFGILQTSSHKKIPFIPFMLRNKAKPELLWVLQQQA